MLAANKEIDKNSCFALESKHFVTFDILSIKSDGNLHVEKKKNDKYLAENSTALHIFMEIL